MGRNRFMLLTLACLPGMLYLPATGQAMENLSDNSMQAVAAEGLGHLLQTKRSATSEQKPAGDQKKNHGFLIFPIPTNYQAIMDSQENTVGRIATANKPIHQTRIELSNDVNPQRVADINVQTDAALDHTQSTESPDGRHLVLTIDNQINSVAAMNARQTPEDLTSRGNYNLDQIRVNNAVVTIGH